MANKKMLIMTKLGLVMLRMIMMNNENGYGINKDNDTVRYPSSFSQ